MGRNKRTKSASAQNESLLRSLDRIVLSETIPTLEACLDLGRELQEARLRYFIDLSIPGNSDPCHYARNLPYTSCRYFWTTDEERLRLKDDEHVKKILGWIEERSNFWPYVRDELAKFAKLVYEELERRVSLTPSRRTTTKSQVNRDKRMEARDKWIYEQCCKGIPHDRIVAELKKRATKRGWKIVSSKQRIQQIGNEYADAHRLVRPLSRQNL